MGTPGWGHITDSSLLNGRRGNFVGAAIVGLLQEV